MFPYQVGVLRKRGMVYGESRINFLELNMYEREGIPVYLRYEIIKLDKDSLILRSVIGGYDPEDYMIYAKQP